MGTAFPGAGELGASSLSQVLTSFFWPRSPPGTETTMTQHRRAPGEPPDPPAGATHRTAGTTAVSKVGTEPSCFLSWQAIPDALGDRLLSFNVEMCSGTKGFVLGKVYLPFFDAFFFSISS